MHEKVILQKEMFDVIRYARVPVCLMVYPSKLYIPSIKTAALSVHLKCTSFQFSPNSISFSTARFAFKNKYLLYRFILAITTIPGIVIATFTTFLNIQTIVQQTRLCQI